jgi:hypothetical protein
LFSACQDSQKTVDVGNVSKFGFRPKEFTWRPSSIVVIRGPLLIFPSNTTRKWTRRITKRCEFPHVATVREDPISQIKFILYYNNKNIYNFRLYNHHGIPTGYSTKCRAQKPGRKMMWSGAKPITGGFCLYVDGLITIVWRKLPKKGVVKRH